MADVYPQQGDTFYLKEQHLENGGYDRKTTVGLAIDAAEKERYASHGAVISEKYAPHDFYLHETYHDIKSTQGKWLSISYREHDFAELEVEAGRDVIYVVYQQEGDGTYTYIGRVSYASIREAIREGSTPYWSMTVVKSNLL